MGLQSRAPPHRERNARRSVGAHRAIGRRRRPSCRSAGLQQPRLCPAPRWHGHAARHARHACDDGLEPGGERDHGGLSQPPAPLRHHRRRVCRCGLEHRGLRHTARQGLARHPHAPPQPRHHRRAGGGDAGGPDRSRRADLCGRRTGLRRVPRGGERSGRFGRRRAGENDSGHGRRRARVGGEREPGRRGDDVARSRRRPAGVAERSTPARAGGDHQYHVDRELRDCGRGHRSGGVERDR